MATFFRTTRILATTSFLAVVSVSAFAHDASLHQPQDTASGPVSESPFLKENDVAMARMMDGMAVKPTGSVNRDFVEMMIPHHQGAIDMAVAYLRYGDNEQLKRLAQEIIVDQQQEIAAMRLALGDPLPASDAVPTQSAPAGAAPHSNSHEEMSSEAPAMQMTNPAN